jgi:hypothetical protein
MNPVYRGAVVAALQCLMVLSLAGKYAVDRARLPRVWAKTAPVDPNLPLRGRYVRMRLEVEVAGDAAPRAWTPVRLDAVSGSLTATPESTPTGVTITRTGDRQWTIAEPVAFFIPERAPDPSRRAPGEELWVEVTVPKHGAPRPIRLGVRKDGVLTPLGL